MYLRAGPSRRYPASIPQHPLRARPLSSSQAAPVLPASEHICVDSERPARVTMGTVLAWSGGAAGVGRDLPCQAAGCPHPAGAAGDRPVSAWLGPGRPVDTTHQPPAPAHPPATRGAGRTSAHSIPGGLARWSLSVGLSAAAPVSPRSLLERNSKGESPLSAQPLSDSGCWDVCLLSLNLSFLIC